MAFEHYFQIMLRVVPFQQRTLAISVNWTFLRLFGEPKRRRLQWPPSTSTRLGFIPGGILFGYVIDTTCIKWQESSCGRKQSCLVHDQSRLSCELAPMPRRSRKASSLSAPFLGTIMVVGMSRKLLTRIAFVRHFIFTALVCKLVSILATIVGYMTYHPTDIDSAASIQTTDSRGPLSLTVSEKFELHRRLNNSRFAGQRRSANRSTRHRCKRRQIDAKIAHKK